MPSGCRRYLVERHHRLNNHYPAPAHELIDAEAVGFDGVPGGVEPNGAVFNRPDAVAPVVGRHEVAAGIAHGGHPELLDEFDDVGAETIASALGCPGS